MTDDAVELTVRGAEKRDAGRGIARLPEAARQRLGVLSGEVVHIAGDETTVAKLWPARDEDEGVVRIDADTRANAGAAVGDVVAVSAADVAAADAVAIAVPAEADVDVAGRAVRRRLRDRPVSPGDALRVDGVGRVVVADTVPDGPVSVGEGAEVTVHPVGSGGADRDLDADAVDVDMAAGTTAGGGGSSAELGESAVDGTDADAAGQDAGDGSGVTDDVADATDGTSTIATDSANATDATDGTSTDGADSANASDATDASDSAPDASRREPDAVESATGEVEPAPTDGASDITYEDIGGLDEELDLVRETIELPLANPELFARLGVDPPKGVLLHGPPGTGKTLIAKAVANEVDATFVSVSGPEIMSQYKGQSEERLRAIFEEARESTPAIVFFDEIDSVAAAREDGADMESRVVGQLLSLMDGLDARGDVVVVGATNRVDDLDPALRRGGRFDREVEIGVPGVAGRREILDVHTRRMPLAETVDLDDLAERTHGFTGADLASLTKEAGMTALRRVRRERAPGSAETEEGEDSDNEADAGGETEPTDPPEFGDAPLSPQDEEPPDVTAADFEAALAAVEPSAMREYVAETPETTFDDVGGLADAERTLRRAVTWPLEYGSLFDAAGTDPPTGVLLHGPPGTGKTLLARAVAGEAGVNFVEVAGPELLDRFVGESEKAVREVFERARQAAPAIVFFDEIDAIAADRDAAGGDSGVGERVVSQLLTELDRAAADPMLVVLASTNRKMALDPALLRPGRLESHIAVPLPDRDAREEILAVHAADTPLADDVDLGDIAENLAGYSGADVAAVVREAALLAVQDVAEEHGDDADDHADEVEVATGHVDDAIETVEPSGR